MIKVIGLNVFTNDLKVGIRDEERVISSWALGGQWSRYIFEPRIGCWRSIATGWRKNFRSWNRNKCSRYRVGGFGRGQYARGLWGRTRVRHTRFHSSSSGHWSISIRLLCTLRKYSAGFGRFRGRSSRNARTSHATKSSWCTARANYAKSRN